MLKFKQFLEEGAISGGVEFPRHKQKYIDPNIDKENHFTLDKLHNGIEAGKKLTIHGTTEVKGKPHVIATP